MANKNYILNSPLLHNGKNYKIGDKVSLSEDDAENLKQILVAEEKPKAKESGEGSGAGEGGNGNGSGSGEGDKQ